MGRDFDDGASEYCYDTSAPATGADITLAAWFKSDDNLIDQCLVSLADHTALRAHWGLYAHGSGALPRVAGHIHNGLTKDFFRPTLNTVAYTTGQWHHAACAFTYDPTPGVVFEPYLDGGFANPGLLAIGDPSGIASCAVGCMYNSAIEHYMSGCIAHAAVWDTALSAKEIQKLAQGQTPSRIRKQNLQAYWPLQGDDDDYAGSYDLTAVNGPGWCGDDPDVKNIPEPNPPPKPKPTPPGQVRYRSVLGGLAAWWPAWASQGSLLLRDMVGNNNALMAGTVPWAIVGELGPSAHLPDNNANYFNAGSNQAICDSDMTIAAWVMFDALTTTVNEFEVIIARSDAGDDYYTLGIKCYTDGERPRWYWEVNGSDMFSGAGPWVIDNVVYHVVVSGANGKAPGQWSLYINGEAQTTSAGSQAVPFGATDTYIGRREWAASEGAMDGHIFDVQIYNRPLMADEVMQLYNPGTRWSLYVPRYGLADEPILEPGTIGGMQIAAVRGNRWQLPAPRIRSVIG